MSSFRPADRAGAEAQEMGDPNLYRLDGYHPAHDYHHYDSRYTQQSHHPQHQFHNRFNSPENRPDSPNRTHTHPHTASGSGFVSSHFPSPSGAWHQVLPASDPEQQTYHDTHTGRPSRVSSSTPRSESTTHLIRPFAVAHDEKYIMADSQTTPSRNMSPNQPRESSSPNQESPIDPNVQPPRQTPHQHIFGLAHGNKGKEGHVDHINEEEPIRFKHLFKRPVIRQWLYQGKLYREQDQRVCSRFELFFDLLFVGLVHQLADGLSEASEPSILSILKFVLLFYMSFSVWTDVRVAINRSGTDDVIQRIFILVIMILLVGFIANAGGIEILPAHEGTIESEEGHASDGEPSSSSAEGAEPLAEHVTRQLIHATGQYLVRRAEEEAEHKPILVQPIGSTGYWFAEGYHKALTAAIGFFLFTKLLKLAWLFFYGLFLPKFRKALWLEMIPVILLAAIYVPLTIVFDPTLLIILITAGIGLDILSKYFISILMQRVHGRTKRSGKSTFIPAQSVEHLAERTVLFVVLVMGESILNSTFKADEENFGVSPEWGRSAISVAAAFFLVWIYFDADSSRVFAHALRRNPFTAISFNLIHFPLCASLILVSSTLPRLIKETTSTHGFRWFYGGSMAVAMASIAVIGMLHKNLDLAGSALWPHTARIVLRLVVALAFAALPVKLEWTNAAFTGTYCGLLGLLVISETLGKIGVVGRRYDADKAAEYYRRLDEHSKTRRRDSSFGFHTAHATEDGGQSHPEDGRGFELRGLGGPAGSMPGPSHESKHVTRPSSVMQMVSTSAVNILETTHRTINPYTSGVKLSRKSSWHEYEDLMPDERGDEDVGVEGELGHMSVRAVGKSERWASVAN
ncbi:unnamed protein product [Sympodiomycopsis kandeliae]